VELGFATEIIDSIEAVAEADLEALMSFGYRNIPNVSNQGSTALEHSPVPETPKDIVDSKETPVMSVPSSNTPPAGGVVMTEAQFKAALEEASANAAKRSMEVVNKVQGDHLRRSLAQMVSDGKLTPVQSKLFGQLAEQLSDPAAEMTYSMKADGSDENKGTVADVVLALAGTMKSHGLLTEQVPGNDAPKMTITQVPASEAALSEGFKASKADIPEASSKEPERWFMDAYTRNVVMKAEPNLKYSEAVLKVERSETYKAALKAFLQS
jgi:hypothetical protein